MLLSRLRGRVATLCLTTVAAAALVASPAAAAEPPSFYDPPTPLPPVRTATSLPRTSGVLPRSLKTVRAPADAQRIMYRSTDTHGEPMAVTGTVLTPRAVGTAPANGRSWGTRPAPKAWATTALLESAGRRTGARPLHLRAAGPGYAVVVTDYQGLGTPACTPTSTGSPRGTRCSTPSAPPSSWTRPTCPTTDRWASPGTSQGGGAAASAAELQPTTRRTRPQGVCAGAPTRRLTTPPSCSTAATAGMSASALAGMHAAYPDLNIPDVLNERQSALRTSPTTASSTSSSTPSRSSDLTVDGRPLTDYLAEEPYRSRVDEQVIGRIAPEVPVLVAHSRFDDLVPFEQARRMAESWCEQGATVRLAVYPTPTHVATAIAAYPEAFAFLEHRFADVPAPSNCGEF